MKVLRLNDAEDHLSEEGVDNGTRMVPAGTVLIVVRGMILAKEFPVAIAMRPICFNQDLKAVQPKEGIDPTYLFYLLMAHRWGIRALADEAAHGTKRIQTDRLLNYRVLLPPLPTQRRIASILSAYDDLIENNTRRIAILEEMARRLYEEWFVHFRFPGYEGAGRSPTDWQRGTLKDVVVLQRGFDLPVKQRQPGEFPVFAATGLHGTHVEPKVKGPGVLTGRSGSLGTVTYVDRDFWPLNTTLWGKEYPLGSRLYAFYLLSSIALEGFNSGAAVPTLNRNDIHGLPTLLPPKELIAAFETFTQPTFDLKSSLRNKNGNLRAQRDLLLPKLVSGEIDVSEAEERMEVAVA